MRTTSKLGLLGALYLSQGLPYGFFTQALPVMMRKSGRSLEEIGLASLLAIPWALKFLWAPWVDRFGLRKHWIVPLQLSCAVVLAAAGWLEPGENFTGLFAVVLLVNALCATQDIATDGLAVELLAPHERGLANGLQVDGYRLGMVLGGGVLLIFFTSLGWKASFVLMAVAIVAATVPLLLHAEQRAPRTTADEGAPHFLQLEGAWPLLLMIFIFKFGEALATAMLRPFMADHGMGLEDVGWMLGTIGFVASLLGALTGGWVAGKLPRKRALLLSATVQALALGSYVVIASTFPERPALALVVALEHFGGGMATAALFTCMMDWSRSRHGAADYTVQASTVVIATGLAAALSGFTAHRLGYVGHFWVAFVLSVCAIAAVIVLFPRAAVPVPRSEAPC